MLPRVDREFNLDYVAVNRPIVSHKIGTNPERVDFIDYQEYRVQRDTSEGKNSRIVRALFHQS